MAFGQDVVGRQRLLDAPLAARLRVQVRRERFGETIREGFDDDRAVVVVFALVLANEFVAANSRGHGECADIVRAARLTIGDKIGE